MTTSIIRIEVDIAAILFAIFVALLVVRTYRRCGLPRWPVQGRWIVTAFVGAWAGRIIDLAIAREFERALNPPHTIIWWAMMDIGLVWIAIRIFTGRLVLVERPRDPKSPMPGVSE